MKILYLGLDPFRYPRPVLHYPILRIEPIPIRAVDRSITHLLFTSRQAVLRWREAGQSLDYTLIAIGPATAELLPCAQIAPEATQEGVIRLLDSLDLHNSKILWPRSSLSRSLLLEQGFPIEPLDLYTTRFEAPLPYPDWDKIEEIVFTSPSCVEGFCALFGSLPKGKKLTAIGPITRARLKIEFEIQGHSVEK